MNIEHFLLTLDGYTNIGYREGARSLIGITSNALRNLEKARSKDELFVGNITR